MKTIKGYLVILGMAVLFAVLMSSCAASKSTGGVKTSCYNPERGWKFVLFSKN